MLSFHLFGVGIRTQVRFSSRKLCFNVSRLKVGIRPEPLPTSSVRSCHTPSDGRSRTSVENGVPLNPFAFRVTSPVFSENNKPTPILPCGRNVGSLEPCTKKTAANRSAAVWICCADWGYRLLRPACHLQQVIPELRLDGTVNHIEICAENDLIKLLHHLTGPEFSQIAA